jgi:subtilisin family serine protease
MRIFAKCLCLFLLIFTVLLVPTQAQASGPQKSYVIRFKDGASGDAMRAALTARNLDTDQVFDDLGVAVVTTDNDAQVQQLNQDTQVEAVSLNHMMQIPNVNVPAQAEDAAQSYPNVTPPPTPTDPGYLQFGWNIRRLGADKAWQLGQTASHDTVVAIVDTGVAVNHPDLAANIVFEGCFNSLQPTCQTYPQFPGPGNHATVVAGVLGSVINGAGLVGVAPNVGIASYNVAELSPAGVPTVYDSSMWAAIQDAARRHFEIVNLSEGEVIHLPLSDEDKERVKNWQRVINRAHAKGVVVVASAGNEGLNLDESSTLTFPCELDHVLCVGATAIRPQPVFPQPGFFDIATFYTSYGRNVDFATPGGDCGGPDFNTCLTAPDPRYFIRTTTVAANPTCAATKSCPVAYTSTIGTSLAAPEAAGVAALVMDAYRARTGHAMNPSDLERVLVHTADHINTTPQLGAGMLNAEAAVKEVLRGDHGNDHDDDHGHGQ